MHRVKWTLVLIACVAAQMPALTAAAKTGLLGGTMKVEYLYTDGTSAPEYTVLPKVKIGKQVEIPDEQMNFGGGKAWNFCVTIDVTADKITFSDIYLLWDGQESHEGRLSPDQFNGFVIKFNKIDPITSVTINPETTLGAATADEGASFDKKAITFSQDEITINWANARITDQSVLVLDVKTGAKSKSAEAEAETESGPDKDPAPANR